MTAWVLVETSAIAGRTRLLDPGSQIGRSAAVTTAADASVRQRTPALDNAYYFA